MKCALWLSEQSAGILTEGKHNKPWVDEAVPTGAAVTALARGLNAREVGKFMLAKTMFDNGEYLRCDDLLKAHCGSAKACFLRYYARYLAGEAKVTAHIANKEDPLTVRNPHAEQIAKALAGCALVAEDPYLLWLHGVVLRKMKRVDEARALFTKSVSLQPLLWCSWQELLALGDISVPLESMEAKGIEKYWIVQFVVAKRHALLHRWDKTIDVLTPLGKQLGQAPAVLQHIASARRHLRQWRKAKDVYEYLLQLHPYRFEGIVEYSNVLFITRRQHIAELCQLARRAFEVAKYRPETCMVLADYHSAAERHEKSYEYYQRALRLDHSSSRDSHILMGHEAIEVKATGPAMAAYREAVLAPARTKEASGVPQCNEDVQKHCGSGWYGLGMAYELFRLPCLTLHHYVRALRQPATLADQQPFWGGVAAMYEEVGLTDDAVRCHSRRTPAAETVLHLARLARRQNRLEASAEHYEQYIQVSAQLADKDQEATHEALLVIAMNCRKQIEAQLAQGAPVEQVMTHIKVAKEACDTITMCGPSVETLSHKQPHAQHQNAQLSLAPQQIYDTAEGLAASLEGLCKNYQIELSLTPVASRKSAEAAYEQDKGTPSGAFRKLFDR